MMDITEYPGLLPKATRSSYDDLLAATVHARVTLEAGFTTVRDLGGATSAIVALKQAIANGVIPGPRMWVSGDALGPTGGHSDKRNGFDPALSKDAWTAGVVDGPLEMARKVRSLHAQGATAIKIMPSGGVSSVGDDPNALLMTDEEIGAAVRTAHILHMRVAAHAHGADAIRRASELGVDSIEHGSFAGTDAYRVMRAKGTFMSPTLTAGLSISDFAREHPGKLEKSVEAKALAIGPIMSRNAGDAFRAGVKLSFGTDAGVFPHGQNAREFALLVKAGVPPTDAILSATSAAAALLDAGADIGTVKAGRFADLIATDTNPLDDITALERVTFVMKGGTVVKSGM
jgi:imidazolonepropionase-like amidohydrolase